MQEFKRMQKTFDILHEELQVGTSYILLLYLWMFLNGFLVLFFYYLLYPSNTTWIASKTGNLSDVRVLNADNQTTPEKLCRKSRTGIKYKLCWFCINKRVGSRGCNCLYGILHHLKRLFSSSFFTSICDTRVVSYWDMLCVNFVCLYM